MTVRKATQFSVSVEDKPGKLAETTKALSEAGINLIALAGWTEGEGKGVIACIPEDPDKLRALECSDGCQPKETEVIVVEGDDKLGVAHAVSQKIADAGVNVKDCIIQAAGCRYQAVIHVDPAEVDKVVAALSGCGCNCNCG